MLALLQAHLATILIIAAIAAVFALMIRSLVKDKKAGKSSCGGGCAGCANACYCHPEAAGAAPAEGRDDSPASSPIESEK